MTSSDTLASQGGQLLAAGDIAGAEALFQQSLALDSCQVFALSNLAWLREQQGRLTEAESLYLRALDAVPDDVHLLQNLGVVLMRLRRSADAERVMQRVLALAPELAAGWSNLGALYAGMQRETVAERCYRHAIILDASYAKARYNLSYLLLRQGRWPEGWQMLESRGQASNFADYFAFPRWHGQPLAGASILICPEAGMGDMLMLCRYAPLLKAMGAARISLLCHAPLARLLHGAPGIDEVIAIGEPVASTGWDWWVPVLSLPGLCGTTLESIPAEVPYLPLPANAEPPEPGLTRRVGLAWKGNPRHENDGERSLASLDMLAPLGTVTGVEFFSLQKGAGENDECSAISFVSGGAALDDMADTAALIASLDLVISVDTAVAHLAGALGKPCWLLLPDYLCDWRWLAGRNDSPWYPTMRLLRQPAFGGWAALIAYVADELRDFSKRRSD